MPLCDYCLIYFMCSKLLNQFLLPSLSFPQMVELIFGKCKVYISDDREPVRGATAHTSSFGVYVWGRDGHGEGQQPHELRGIGHILP